MSTAELTDAPGVQTALAPVATPGPVTAAEPAPELSVIVVSYRTRALTLRALATVVEQTRDTRYEILLLDNASDDGSADAVAAAFPRVRLIRSAENLGFAAGNNRAIREARGRYLLLLNPDTEVRDGAIDRLLDFAKRDGGGGIYGGRTVFPDGSLNIASCWNRMTPWSVFCLATGLTAAFRQTRLFNPEAIGGWRRDSVRRVDIVVGCFFLIGRELWDALDGFDETFFMYGEEADLCLRAAERGVRPVITPDAEIVHLVGASSQRREDKLMTLLRSKATLIRRYWPRRRHAWGLGMLRLWVLLRRVGFDR